MNRKSIIIIIEVIFCLFIESCIGGKSVEDYNFVGEFKDGYALANLNGTNNLLRYVIIDKDYEPVTDEMINIETYSDDYWIAETVGGDFVAIDRQLKIIPLDIHSPRIYDRVSTHTIWAKNSDDDMVLVDLRTGKQISNAYADCSIDQVLNNGTVVLKLNSQNRLYVLSPGYAMVDVNGRELVPFNKYTFIGDFSNGLASFSTTGYGIPLHRVNTKYSQINTIQRNDDPKWFELGNQYGEFGRYDSDQFRQGYINESGEVVIPQKFIYAQPFDEDGFAIVGGTTIRSPFFGSYTREYSKIDKSGKIIKSDINVKERSDCTFEER